MATTKRGNEIPTIDVALVTFTPAGGDTEIALDTANQIEVSVQSQTQDAVQLIVKGRLIAQKREKVTITGHTITLTDNVFNPELVKMLQGGTIKYWTSADQTDTQDTDAGFGVASYTPPVAGSTEEVKPGTLKCYSSIYDAAGILTGYECISYPNATGTPIALNSEDDAFRAPEYTINSAPSNGQAPYEISYVKELPDITEA